MRRVIAVHDRDLPFRYFRTAAEDFGRSVANRLDLVRTCTHGILALPCTRGDTAPGLPVDHHRQTDEAVELLERW